MSSSAATKVRAQVEPALRDAGFDLDDVVVRQAGSRRLVQIVVDKDGGLTVDDVADAARAVSAVLDETDVLTGAYVLEVTSPGVDRPLIEPRHWRRNVGRLVEARLKDGRAVTGRLVAADDTTITLDGGDAEQQLALADVARGQVQLEFSRIDEIPASEERD